MSLLFLTRGLVYNGTGSLAARAQREFGQTGKRSLFARAQSIAAGGPFPLVAYAIAGMVGCQMSCCSGCLSVWEYSGWADFVV
jgi:hypothetical protein